VTTLLKRTRIDIRHLSTETSYSIEASPSYNISVTVESSDIFQELSKHDLNIICYVGGYIAHSMVQKINCESFHVLFYDLSSLPTVDSDSTNDNEFIRLMSRGGLKSPSHTLHMLCCWAYLMFMRLKCSPEWNPFLPRPIHKCLLFSIVKNR
jgi:hypothetical protein